MSHSLIIIHNMHQSEDRQAIRWHLHVIFLYYASYADRNNYKLLKSQNYRRFLIDSQTVTEQTAFPPFDIAFRKIHTTAISQTQFQELIPNLAQLTYPQKKRKEAFEAYVRNHLERLYDDILHKSDFGADVIAIETLKVQQNSLELLQSVPLRKAYKKYIENTAMHQKNPEQTFEHAHAFLADFEISPKLVYKAMTYLIFFYLLRTKGQNSTRYEVEDFKRLLIYIAEVYWRRIETDDRGQAQKVLLIMQQMQLSVGFKKMVDKTLKESAVMVSFFKRNYTHRLQTEENRLNGSFEKQNDSLQKSGEKGGPKTAKHQHERCISFFSAKKERKEDLGTVRDLLQQVQNGIDIREIKSIFENMCRQGEVANTKTLKSIKIKKFFQTNNMLSPISQSWLDLKVTELCRSSPSGKIEFPHFLQLLVLASKQLNITIQALYEYLIENARQQPIVPSSYSTKETKDEQGKAKQIQTSRVTLNIFYQIEKQLQRIFMHYSAKKSELYFQQLTHLLYDFDVFPSFITKSKLYQLFQQFAHSRSALRGLVGEISLNMDEFLQVLHRVSAEIGQNLSSEQQVLFMLERMQDSAGHRTILGRQGTNLIGDLRSRYSEIYMNAMKRNTNNNDQKMGFQELIQEYQP